MSNSYKSNREQHNHRSEKTFHGGATARRPNEKWVGNGLLGTNVPSRKTTLLILVAMLIACSSSVTSSKTRRNPSSSISKHDDDELTVNTSPTFSSFSYPQHVHHHGHHHHHHRHSRRHYRHPPDVGDRDAVVNVFTIFDPTQTPANQNHTTATIQRLVVDPNGGTVYVGASNSLYQLSPELGVVHNLTTGPLMDNPYCPPPHSSCECLISGCKEEKPTSTDSIVRTMVIDQKDGKLIVCYSLFKGHCRKYLLGNISVAETPRYTMMVPSDENSSVVMFIAPGPPNPASTDVLYIATTRSNKGLMAYKDSVPTICTRNIQDFEFVSSDILVPSKIDVEIQQREIFKVHYVHGFSSLGFSYFLSLQKTSVKNVTMDRLVSRISRICHGDKTLYSYTEIPFECWVPEPVPSNGADSSDADDDDFGMSSSRRRSPMHSQRQRSATNYNVLLAAAVIRPGSLLAKRLGLSDVPPMSELEDVLVGVFGAQDPHNTSSGSVPAASSGLNGNLNDNMGTNQGNHDSGVGSGAALPGSAICIYPMRDVRRIFTETIQSCFEGIGNIGPDHFVQPIPCKTAKFEITDEYCGEYDVNHPIIGSNPISSSAAILLDRVKVTSLAATTANDETVLFVGTDRGDVRKVKINSENEAVEYDRITVEPGVPVGRDLNFDPQHKHLYAFLNQTVYRVAVEKCATYETCGECIGAGDPYCGWCSLKKRCTAKDMCSDSHLSLRWLSSGSCARIVKVVSNQAQKISNSTSLVIMTVQNLPVSLSGDYYCTFSGHGVSRTTSANITADRIHGHDRHGGNVTLKCETPRANLLPPFPTGKDHILMTLSLTSDELDHLSTNFTFFDCSVHNSCTKCTTSSYPCTWCTQSNRCTGNKEDCMADTLITGVKVPGNSDTPGPAYCPRIENIIANSSEILIPSGSELALRVRVIQYQSFQSPLRCSFSFNGGHEVEANLVASDVIECSSIKFDYSSSTHFRNVPFGITWGDEGRKNLDNPTNVQVRIFKCQEMASNCGRCRAVDFRLNCGWCRHPGASGEEGRCTTRSSCSQDAWMLNSQPCRDAYIIDVYPRKGPLEGGTLLTVKGENLGLEPQDTQVHIRGLNCKVMHYDPSIEFTCMTSNSSELFSSSLAVTVSHNVTFASDVHFSYVTSKLSSVHPLLGPMSGGSILTISGHNLDSGSNVTVELSSSSSGRSTPCVVRDRTSDRLKCITATSNSTYTADRLEVRIDRSSIGLNSELGLFTFMEDPVVTSVDNKKAVFGGGNLITVRGVRLHVVSKPRMVVYRDEDRFTSSCTVVSDVEMICLFPNVTSSRGVPPIFGHRHYRPHVKTYDASSAESSDPRSSHPRKSREADDAKLLKDFWAQGSDQEQFKIRESSEANQNLRDLRNRSPVTVEPLVFHYGFVMDGVKSLLNFSDTFQVYPDPEVEMFEGGTKKGYSNKLEHFTINGHHLNLALTKDDYRVTIGDEECEVTSLSASYLMCSMKHIYNVPSSAGVKVYVGNLTVHHLGTLEHDGWPKSPLTSMPFLLGIGGTVLFLVIIVGTICWCYRVKTKRNTRVMRRLKNQMDILESRVAKECKEAFAELQTDMTDVSQDYMGKIPFRDYRSFCANVLFPGVSVDHSVFRWGTGTGLPPHLLPPTPNSQHQQLLLQHHQNLQQQQQLDNSYSTCSSLDPVGAESLLLAFSPTNTGLSGKGLFSRSGQLKDQLVFDTSGKGPRMSGKMAAESTTNTLNNSSTSFISSICSNMTRDSLKEVEGLLLNRSFLLTLIRTLESRKDFIVREKVNFASLLSVALQPFMDYHTDILKTLLSDLIERAMEKQNHPKLLLRRTESVAEKMLTNWFAFLLFKFLKDRAGEKLFMLFRAVKQQVEKGPVDQVTSEARYSLSEEKLIRQQVDFQIMTLQVLDPESVNQQPIHQVKVLDCDTISQVKEKILDVVYRHSGFSSRPSKDGLDIEWINPLNSQSFILQDEDESNEMSGEYKKLNTLAHYRLPDQSFVSLVARQNPYGNPHQKLENFSGSLPSSYSLSHNIPLVTQSSIKNCHLVKSNEQDNHKDDRGSKMVSEVYLTRLLATKGTLQTFVDDLFQTIFSCNSTSPVNNQQTSLLPLAIKYMFDFFDDQATHHGICDPEVVHTWKSNSLPLRFWVNIVKNPDFVFDIHKSNIVDACLSVIGQTFMDSCCMSDHKLSKDSPSSKLLYAKDIPKYKSWVIKYYEDIKQMPSLGEHEMMEVLKRESQIHMKEFNTEEALREISRYIFKYYDDFTQALSEDEFCRRDRLSERLDAIHRRSTSS